MGERRSRHRGARLQSLLGKDLRRVLGATWAGADANELQLWMHLPSECLLKSCTLGIWLASPQSQDRPRNTTHVAERGTRGWGQNQTRGSSAPRPLSESAQEKAGRKERGGSGIIQLESQRVYFGAVVTKATVKMVR